jgi:HPt (histidine-containing phosphotransfer) domain-containing protein
VGDFGQRVGRIALEPSPLSDSQIFAPAERRALIEEVIAGTEALLGKLREHVAAADLAAAARTAHSARNNALSVGAGELAQALQAFEAAARGDLAASPERGAGLAAQALGRAQELWQPTRDAMQRLAAAAMDRD